MGVGSNPSAAGEIISGLAVLLVCILCIIEFSYRQEYLTLSSRINERLWHRKLAIGLGLEARQMLKIKDDNVHADGDLLYGRLADSHSDRAR